MNLGKLGGTSMIKIAPSILSADFSNLERDILTLEKAGADMLHIDVMDGHFVPNLTIGAPVVKSLRKVTSLIFDVHLMIDNPELYIKDYYEAGADIITIHAETSKHLHRLIQTIKDLGVKAGLALNPATPLCVTEHLIGNMYEKIISLKKLLIKHKRQIPIQVDGGVTLDNIQKLYNCGAEIMVAGSAIFNSKDINKTILLMKSLNGVQI